MASNAEKVLDEILEKATESTIFTDRDKLTPDYVPENLPFREEQVAKLAGILVQTLRGYRANNVFIYGLTGTGKTAVARLVTRKIGEKARELGKPVETAYVNCRMRDTEYRVLADILETLGKPVPFTGLSISELETRLQRALDSTGKRLIVVLDEIDYLLRKQGDNLLYRLTRLNSHLRRGSVTIVGITNDIKLVETLDPRVKSSLGEEEIVFPPYNAPQLKKILEERARLAFKPNVLEPGVIDLCAAIAAREHGDARKALDLLRTAGEIAEREGSTSVRREHVEKARNQLERDRVYEVVATLPLHAKLVLLAALRIATTRGKATTGEIYGEYQRIAKALGLDPVTPRRATDIISELDMLGILHARVVSRGRYGKTKIVTLAAEPRSIESALRDDEVIGRLLSQNAGVGV